MSPKRTLYLHVGMPKTGSTAIQNYLYLNRESLNQQGFYYPLTIHEIMGTEAYLSSRGADLVSAYPVPENTSLLFYQNVFNARWYETGQSEEADMIFADIAKNDSPRVLFSGEAIGVMPDFYFLYKKTPTRSPELRRTQRKEYLEKVRRHFSDFDVKVLVYLRRQDEFMESFYAQLFKEYIFIDFTIDDLEDRLPMDYYKAISEIADVFGKPNVIVRPFEAGQLLDGDLLADFCFTVGIDPDGLKRPPSNPVVSNSALAPQFMSFKQAAYEGPPLKSYGWQDYTNILRNLSYHSQSKAGAKPQKMIFLSQTKRSQLLERYRESNAMVAREYLPEGRDTLFLETPIPVASSDFSLEPKDVAQISSALFVEAQTKIRVLERLFDRRVAEILARCGEFESENDALRTRFQFGFLELQEQTRDMREEYRSSIAVAQVSATQRLDMATTTLREQFLSDLDRLRADFESTQRGLNDELYRASDHIRLQIETAIQAVDEKVARSQATQSQNRKMIAAVKQSRERSDKDSARMIVAMWKHKRSGFVSRLHRLIRSEMSIIRSGKLFDTDYYLNQNPAVKEAAINPLKHYVEYGAGELRDPSSKFSTADYFRHHPRVALTGRNPLVDHVLRKRKHAKAI
jgi:hypothetical protein